MADIVLNLGTVTVVDNSAESGNLTQADLNCFLDEQFDPENAGGDYENRMITAFRTLGINGVTSRTAHCKLSKARKVAGQVQSGLVS